MSDLPHRLERTVVVHARPERVFRFFTDPARWAQWWGAGSTIDARPGGRATIRYPNGVEAGGEVLEVVPPERLVFTYGYESGTPIPIGASRVTILLEPHAAGTRLRLAHDFADAALCDQHVQGWRYQLSVFANVVADEVCSGAAGAVDAWLAGFGDSDEAARELLLRDITTPEVRFGDRFGLVSGREDLLAHVAALQRFMPGMRLEREGSVRHCLGTVLADWRAVAPDGAPRGRGTNVFVFDADGRIDAVTGLWEG